MPRYRLLLLGLLLTARAGAAVALEHAAFSAGVIEGSGWRAEQLQIALHLPPAGEGSAEISIGTLDLPEPLGRLRNLKLACAQLSATAQRLSCRNARLTATGQGLGKSAAQVDFSYVAASGALELAVRALPLYGGKADLQLALHDSGGTAQLTVSRISFSEPSGKYATEKLQLKASGEFARRDEAWRFRLDSAATGGQIYVEPLFVDIQQQPLKLAAAGRYTPATGQLGLERISLSQAQTLQATAQLSARLKPAFKLEQLSAELAQAQLPAAYAYVQPFLIGTALDALNTQGALQGRVRLEQGALSAVEAELREVFLHDTKERFSVDALNGAVRWARSGAAGDTQLRWRGGSAYKVPFEAAELALRAQGDGLTLLKPLRQPLLGGALLVERFAASAFGEPAQRIDFEGRIEPIDLQALCKALGWPEFGGTLAGRLPQLSYSQQVLSVGGTLAAQVFDGEVAVDDFRLGNPLGPRPQLSGDIRLRNIDLAQATGAFSFGRIEGRLHGEVEDLQMLNWRPVAFDAKFYTPPDDDSRHRISQRAIENISAIGGGGGATGVLSKGFLRFFDDFAYERIGLSCVLRNNRCRMGGIEPKDGGYYIVKGARVPRIDVIGYAREVDWDALLEQLRNATAGAGPVIK